MFFAKATNSSITWTLSTARLWYLRKVSSSRSLSLQQHGFVEQLTDRRLDAGRVLFDEIPPRLVGHPEDVVADVEVPLVDEQRLLGVRERAGAPLFETVRNVFQKNEAERDMLVFGGIHVAAQLVRSGPKGGLKRQRRRWRTAVSGFRADQTPLRVLALVW
jgi:hypothetical protein